MKKYVIYEAIIGEYDNILQPIIVDDRFDYVLFSDTILEPNVGVWQVRQLPHIEGTNKLKSGFAKCQINELLGSYEASLWIDGNIQIATQYVYDRFIELLGRGVEWASIKHPDQHCTYDEICAIVDLRWVLDSQVIDWYSQLRKQKFPDDWGLYETNVLFRRHNSKVYSICDIWWNSLLQNIRRDQFSVMYALWIEKPKMDFYLPEEECPRIGSVNFNYILHKPHKRVLKLGFHEMMRYRFIRTKYPDNVRQGYHVLFDKLSQYRHPKQMLYVWEFFEAFVIIPKLLINKLLAANVDVNV